MSHSAILGIMDIQNLHFKIGVIKRKKEPDIDGRESSVFKLHVKKV